MRWSDYFTCYRPIYKISLCLSTFSLEWPCNSLAFMCMESRFMFLMIRRGQELDDLVAHAQL
jgi:hypothetical protein